MAELIEWVKTAKKPVDKTAVSMAELSSSKLMV